MTSTPLGIVAHHHQRPLRSRLSMLRGPLPVQWRHLRSQSTPILAGQGEGARRRRRRGGHRWRRGGSVPDLDGAEDKRGRRPPRRRVGRIRPSSLHIDMRGAPLSCRSRRQRSGRFCPADPVPGCSGGALLRTGKTASPSTATSLTRDRARPC